MGRGLRHVAMLTVRVMASGVDRNARAGAFLHDWHFMMGNGCL